MKYTKKLITVLLGAMLSTGLNAQDANDPNSFIHKQSDDYEWPTDKAILEKLDRWQDLKFGTLLCWGIYSVPGICESWPICSEDWINRPMESYYDYKRWYFSQSEKFNPTQFNPDQWAEVMKDAGMKYMIFTSKHHDGFCLYDSKYTDFTIAKGPFKDNPKKDAARYVFDAFRRQDFMVGCYFSKPDWHSEWFWNPYFDTGDRMPNYNREKHPEWWKNFQDFTYNQLTELMTDYGRFDILWLDGGWISGDEVRLNEVLANARSHKQPGMIAVDRTIKGKNENYQTPEQMIPDRQINHPWESCITLSGAWGWIPNAKFKSAHRVINQLSEIVAKGGCLLLGVGPTPEGLIQPEAIESLHGIGEWLRVYGKAIYSTRTTPHYQDGCTWFTADKDGHTLYAIYALPEGQKLPETIEWTGNLPTGTMKLLKGNRTIKYTCKGNKVTVTLPKGLKDEPIALSFRIK